MSNSVVSLGYGKLLKHSNKTLIPTDVGWKLLTCEIYAYWRQRTVPRSTPIYLNARIHDPHFHTQNVNIKH